MRHHNHNRKLSRERNQRKALLNTLATSLVSKEKIETTLPKAKELRPFIERLITYGKKGGVTGRRLLNTHLGSTASKKVLDKLSPKFAERKGGYTRIVKLGRRIGDGSPRARIEFVE